ncbi:hypothetical protein EZS27_010992 [termite gut metagenome]|uniref:Endonuclease GajA/Old nuclease/RecF-like AAA domain-containing protein n=1 Tax=termite gut metagenome TaxID=433724 RepID=A0A5J4S535_9ZZZZ
MSRIKIEKFGPIKNGYQNNDGWIDIKKVTVFIGNQGSGKSTVAKLISTFTWIEKALVRGNYDKKWFEKKNKLKNQYLNYHRLENYLKINDDATIEYQGDAYSIKYEGGRLTIEETSNNTSYPLPQIMYVPAERNFISYVKTPKGLKLSSESLKEFLTEFDNAKAEMKGFIKLPVNNIDVEYDKLNDTLNLRGSDYKVKLTDASSGFQSLVPLFLVSSYLSSSVKKQSETNEPMSNEESERFKKGVEHIWGNDYLTEEQRRVALSVLASKFNKTAFVNIVEEPEQNLFPDSQWQMLQSLLKFNNMNPGNKLILTTHSPYMVNFLNIAIQGKYLKNKIIEKSVNTENLLSKLTKIVSENALIASNDVIVYQLDETDGSMKELNTFEGVLSDKNYLNNKLREGNQLFDALLEIEEELCA